VKNFRPTLFFRASASCSKILNDKKYIFNTVNSGHTVLWASASCSKILDDKKYFNTVKKFRATLFFRANTSCSKSLNDKKYIQDSEKFQGKLCVSGQAQVAQKSCTVKKFSIQCISDLKCMQKMPSGPK